MNRSTISIGAFFSSQYVLCNECVIHIGVDSNYVHALGGNEILNW